MIIGIALKALIIKNISDPEVDGYLKWPYNYYKILIDANDEKVMYNCVFLSPIIDKSHAPIG